MRYRRAMQSDSGPNIRLDRLQIVNFRRIGHVDVKIPTNKRAVCLVGANGSGKSSVLSVLVRALVQLTRENLPDAEGNPPSVDNGPLKRSYSTAEIGRNGRAAGLVCEWTGEGGSHTFRLGMRDPQASQTDVRDLYDLLSLRYAKSWLTVGWDKTPSEDEDPIARSVFLYRPADRYERPYYEALGDDHKVAPMLAVKWNRQRLFPVRVQTGGPEVERFLLDLILAIAIPGDRSKKIAQRALDKCRRVFSHFVPDGGDTTFFVGPWPYRRVAPSWLRALDLLSAGELDILCTAVLIIAQQVYLMEKFRSEYEDPENAEPSGVVFIDEIDAHLHPEKQEAVVPLLLELFPTVQFVFTTHSPFILRSLDPADSTVVRFPDGRLFAEDLRAWNIEEILGVVFQVPARWSADVQRDLDTFKAMLASDADPKDTAALYAVLAARGRVLRAEMDKHVAALAAPAVREAIRSGAES